MQPTETINASGAPETPESQTEVPSEIAPAECVTYRLATSLIDDIAERLRDEAELLAPAADENVESRQIQRTEFLGDMKLLHGIVQDWESQSCGNEYPNETRLIAAIRGNLE